mmetsp:Transcript_104955/g.185400  ORF Transcript_104955/g.185400 Transcript_104955/m.185400 type:complete len:622 (-) Transcript_104955:128-1993(-)
MGAGLPKAVTSVVIKRHGGTLCRVGMAEMNGWRASMEDAHVVFMRDKWGFFGVFDGHGGSQCSNFIARRFVEELEKDGAPQDDAALVSLALRLDREFLQTKQSSGSTGTFAILHAPEGDEAQYRVRVGNLGDSRVLLGRADGTMVEGKGTDGGLTTDHKPDHPDEKARIERTGGFVQHIQGVARVNADLAMSRAFGDGQYKQTGDPQKSDHPVSAYPELTTISCDPTDFLVLVCDGISEGDFPNREVIKLAAEGLRNSGAKSDPGSVAATVCHKALQSGSKDNLSCMIVQLGGGPLSPETALLPGRFEEPTHGQFRKAYQVMAEHAGLTLAQAVEMRYDIACRDRVTALAKCEGGGTEDSMELKELKAELAAFGEGPPGGLTPGSAERLKWFAEWLESNPGRPAPDYQNMVGSMTRDQVLDLLTNDAEVRQLAVNSGIIEMPDEVEAGPAQVRVPPEAALRAAIESTNGQWTDVYSRTSGQIGEVVEQDESSETTLVRFDHLNSISCWLPTACLVDIQGQVVCVAPMEQLKPAVLAMEGTLTWNKKLEEVCGQHGLVECVDNSEGVTQVSFPEPIGISCWLPSAMLTYEEELPVAPAGRAKASEDSQGEAAESQAKRQRMS